MNFKIVASQSIYSLELGRFKCLKLFYKNSLAIFLMYFQPMYQKIFCINQTLHPLSQKCNFKRIYINKSRTILEQFIRGGAFLLVKGEQLNTLGFYIEWKDFQQQKNKVMNKPFYGAASIPQSQRHQIVNKQNVPGPGTYGGTKEKGRNDLPKWTLKKRLDHGSCFQNLSSTPGPGKYKNPESFKKQKEMIISTKGQKFRNFFDKSYPHTPIHLPGAINLKSGYSFGYRQAPRDAEKSPGPVYHLDQITENKRAQKNEENVKGFGTEKKNILKGSCTPGPGSFDHEPRDAWKNKTSENWSFGTSKRSESLPATQLGPGQYNLQSNSSHGKMFKLRGRNEAKYNETSIIGPGAYNIPDTKTKVGTKFNKPKGDKDNFLQQTSNKEQDKLSPCSYSPPRYLDRPDEHGYSLGIRIEQNYGKNAEEPGPGAYQIEGRYVKGKGGYMGRKVQHKKKENISMDNFYRYDPNLNAVAPQPPKFSFPQGSKQLANRHTSSSQQFHQTIERKPSGYHFSMGTSKRFPELKKESAPFKERETDYSTIGMMPNYLKKTAKKK